MALGSDSIVVAATADDDRRATIAVTGGDDAVGREDEHGARAFDIVVDILNAFNKVLAL